MAITENAKAYHERMFPGYVSGFLNWHGAACDSWFAHLAVEVPAEGASNEWLEPVTDEVYSKLK